MNLFATIDNIKDIGLSQPNVRTAVEGDIYSVMNTTKELKYGVFVITQGQHRSDDNFNYFSFNFFYVDRLVDDLESNRLQIQSIGIQQLDNIIKTFSDEYYVDLNADITFNTFTQKFADECAGVYCNLTLEVPKDYYCGETYTNKKPIRIYNTTINKTITENGEYIITYDKDIYTGIEEVNVVVEVDTTDAYNEGKADGFQEGIEQGMADGVEEGIEQGKIIGREEGIEEGKVIGREEGIEQGKVIGREEGKVIGREEAIESLPSLVIEENGLYEGAYKDIEVNVPQTAKISLKDSGIKLGYSNFNSIPDVFDFSGVTNMRYMFCYCENILTIPYIDTSNVTDMYYMFQGCSKLETIPSIDTSKVQTMYRMFSDTSISSLPEFDCSSLTNIERIFYSTGDKLVECGGWKNLKINWTDNYGLSRCPNLSYQSCINILNGLYDFTGNGETPDSNQGKLRVNQRFLDLVGDEISIAISKGWNIYA